MFRRIKAPALCRRSRGSYESQPEIQELRLLVRPFLKGGHRYLRCNGGNSRGRVGRAVQLGMYLSIEFKADAAYRLINTLKLVPFVVDAHDEVCDWRRLSTVVQMLGGCPRIRHSQTEADWSITRIRRSRRSVDGHARFRWSRAYPRRVLIRSTHPLS
jgi:hypothetical protein